MTLTLSKRKYFQPYTEVGKPSRWQTHVVAEDISVLLSGYGIRCRITSDDDESLVSWSAPDMQFWIGIECSDTQVPTFQLNIGAGKRMMLIFARSFPDSVFADAPWFIALQEFARGE